MQKNHPEAQHASSQDRPPAGMEIDYSPKTYTPREKLLFGVKISIITGIAMLLLWLIER